MPPSTPPLVRSSAWTPALPGSVALSDTVVIFGLKQQSPSQLCSLNGTVATVVAVPAPGDTSTLITLRVIAFPSAAIASAYAPGQALRIPIENVIRRDDASLSGFQNRASEIKGLASPLLPVNDDDSALVGRTVAGHDTGVYVPLFTVTCTVQYVVCVSPQYLPALYRVVMIDYNADASVAGWSSTSSFAKRLYKGALFDKITDLHALVDALNAEQVCTCTDG